jgi:hypothetical protein
MEISFKYNEKKETLDLSSDEEDITVEKVFMKVKKSLKLNNFKHYKLVLKGKKNKLTKKQKIKDLWKENENEKIKIIIKDKSVKASSLNSNQSAESEKSESNSEKNVKGTPKQKKVSDESFNEITSDSEDNKPKKGIIY